MYYIYLLYNCFCGEPYCLILNTIFASIGLVWIGGFCVKFEFWIFYCYLFVDFKLFRIASMTNAGSTELSSYICSARSLSYQYYVFGEFLFYVAEKNSRYLENIFVYTIKLNYFFHNVCLVVNSGN